VEQILPLPRICRVNNPAFCGSRPAPVLLHHLVPSHSACYPRSAVLLPRSSITQPTGLLARQPGWMIW